MAVDVLPWNNCNFTVIVVSRRTCSGAERGIRIFLTHFPHIAHRNKSGHTPEQVRRLKDSFMYRVTLQTMLLIAGFLTLADVPKSNCQEAAAPAASPNTKNPDAQAAEQAYNQLRSEWRQIIGQIEQVQENQAADADVQLRQLRKQADALLDQIVEAALQVYRADANAYPKVNSMLVSLAQFFVEGNPATGDGGDQFEKALSIAKTLLEGGEGEKTPELWLWGAVSAFATNDHALARQYFAKVDNARGRRNSRSRAWQLAVSFLDLLDTYGDAWQQEQKIRQAEAEADDLPRVKFTTDKGHIVIELFENDAPIAVASFISLVKQGYYDGLTFHRVLPRFMAQGGCPEGTGRGGPGYNIRDEHTKPNYRKHFRGSLSMAKTPAPNTAGSQFFLTFIPTTHLNGKHTVFGRVMEGIEVAAALTRRNPDAQGPHPTPDKILKAEVLRDRGHAYKFEKMPGR